MLTAAVVGCGPRGREHAGALRAIDGIELVGVVDRPGSRRGGRRRAGRAGVRHRRRPARPRRGGLVVLATPASGRLALVESILEGRGVRALVLEKPMALRLAEAHRILGLCE